MILNSGDREAIILGKTAIKRNNLVTTIPLLTKAYTVYFEAMPTSVYGSWSNVLHFTSLEGGYANSGKYGSRAPAIFPLGKTWYIASPVSGNSNYYKNMPVIKTNEWSTFMIKQSLENGKYIYRVFVNGKKIDERVNTQPREFHELKVYAGDPWYVAQPGFVKNVYMCGKDYI